MKLDPKPFYKIKNRQKDTEYRLNDKKRKSIKVGDTITFYKRPEEKERIKVIVVGLKYYKTLLEMFTDNFEKNLKNEYVNPQKVVENFSYYSEKDIKRYGCVAINIKLK